MVMAADIVSRFKAGEPVLYYTYTPLWVSQMLRPGVEVEWLEVPFTVASRRCEREHDPAGWTQHRLFESTTSGSLPITSSSRQNPVAKKWFELVTIPIDDVNTENLQI